MADRAQIATDWERADSVATGAPGLRPADRPTANQCEATDDSDRNSSLCPSLYG